MSRQDYFESPVIGVRSGEPADCSDLQLQVDLRLKLDEVVGVQAELLRSSSRTHATKSELAQLAGRIYDARRIREKILDPCLFGEPAWDMLLALYVLPARGEMLRPGALAHAANVAPTTGLRWEGVLTKYGFIERGPVALPSRRQFVRLTENGRNLMNQYLTRLFFAQTPVPPFPERAGGYG